MAKAMIGINSKVEITIEGIKHKWEIVKPGQTDLSKNRIAYDAPFIQTILDLPTGEEVEIVVKDRKRKIKIDKITP